MTGNLKINKQKPYFRAVSSNLNTQIGQTSTVSENTSLGAYIINDINNHDTGWLEVMLQSDKNLYQRVGLRRYDSQGNEINNHLTFNISNSGTKSITFTDPQAWKQALDLGNSGKFAVRFKTGSITLAAGTSSSPTTKDISLTTTDCPSGYSVWGVICTLGNYLLPFTRATDNNYTKVSTYNDTKVTIENTSGIWNNYTYYMILFLYKD